MSGPKFDGSPTGTKLPDGTLWPDPVFVADASWWLRYGHEIGGGEMSQTQRFGTSSALSALLTLATHPCGMEMLEQYRAHVAQGCPPILSPDSATPVSSGDADDVSPDGVPDGQCKTCRWSAPCVLLSGGTGVECAVTKHRMLGWRPVAEWQDGPQVGPCPGHTPKEGEHG